MSGNIYLPVYKMHRKTAQGLVANDVKYKYLRLSQQISLFSQKLDKGPMLLHFVLPNRKEWALLPFFHTHMPSSASGYRLEQPYRLLSRAGKGTFLMDSNTVYHFSVHNHTLQTQIVSEYEAPTRQMEDCKIKLKSYV